MEHISIQEKANRILYFVLLAMILILIRVWYLQVVKHEQYEKQAIKPRRLSRVERYERATIRDRFGLPLAVNHLQYNATISYAAIRDIPAVIWEKDSNGKKIRIYPRREYIRELTKFLKDQLGVEAQSIEDLIYAKAALFPHTTFVVKENVDEETYYRLRMKESHFPGLSMQQVAKRFYPQGRVAGDIIGYLGAIDTKSYWEIADEINRLENYLQERSNGQIPFLPSGYSSPVEVKERLDFLRERSYRFDDLVGKGGIEGKYDSRLRGSLGKRIFETDSRGHILRELPKARFAGNGEQITLTISSELQRLAEELLVEREAENEDHRSFPAPWIKGGSIIAMLPKTGEIVAFATHPRFEPNDFIPSGDEELKKEKNYALNRWLETESMVGEIWDGTRPFLKEEFNRNEKLFSDRKIDLTWPVYLKRILNTESAVYKAIQRFKNLEEIYQFLSAINRLCKLSDQQQISLLIQALYPDDVPVRGAIDKEELFAAQSALVLQEDVPYLKGLVKSHFNSIKHNNDKLLLIDVMRLIIDIDDFPEELLDTFGKLSPEGYREITQLFLRINHELYTTLRQSFHLKSFGKWREENFKSYLKEKRREEKKLKKVERPFTEYLERCERDLWQQFWLENRWEFICCLIDGEKKLHDQIIIYEEEIDSFREKSSSLREHLQWVMPEHRLPFLHTIRSYDQLVAPLVSSYRQISGKNLQHLAAAFYPPSGFGYMQSHAYRQPTPAGSIFKLITAYAALKERWDDGNHRDLNPLTIDDQTPVKRLQKKNAVYGYFSNGKPIHRHYKGGVIPPSSRAYIGKIDLKEAIETTSNVYFAVLAGDKLSDPRQLLDAAQDFGFSSKTGIELPGELKGLLPDDLVYNRNGLYAFSMGQHSLLITPLQAAAACATFANQGKLIKPRIIDAFRGEKCANEYDCFAASNYRFEEPLSLIGIDFPLFTQIIPKAEQVQIEKTQVEINNHVELPDPVRSLIFEGMWSTVNGTRGTARLAAIRGDHLARQTYAKLRRALIGKTGTAEFAYKPTVDAESRAENRTHGWFVAVSFKTPKDPMHGSVNWDDPELVVVVYLRHGNWGREGAPIAGQIIDKWRSLNP